MIEKRNAAQAAARNKTPIDPVWLCACLNAVMPRDTIYIDEVTTHTALLRQHLVWNEPQSLFTRQGGLGQGLGLSLGIKLGKPERQVVTLIGDGAFLYNPALGCLGAARDYKLPTMTVIFNNKKYAAMQGMHHKMYPDGIAAEIDLYHGTHINAPSFVKVAESVDGYGEQVTRSGKAPGRAEARPRSQPKRQAGDHRRDRYIDDTEEAVVPTLATALHTLYPKPKSRTDQRGKYSNAW